MPDSETPRTLMFQTKDLKGICGSSCHRRWHVFASLATDIIFANGDARVISHVAWLAFIGLAIIVPEQSQTPLVLASSFCLFFGLCLITLFDVRYLVIPDGPLIALCVCAPLAWPTLDLQQIISRVSAAISGYAFLHVIAYAYVSTRKQAGVGYGDASLYAVAGFWLGFAGLPSCLIYAALSALGATFIAIRLGMPIDMRTPLPFAPHLALGLWLSYVFGPLEFG